jgi:hypothetical protein
MVSWFKSSALLLPLLLAFSALAQEPALRGTWTATAGSQTFRGSWGAETSAHNPDYAQGYWTLLNDSGERVLEGTWSARKTAARWHGTWTARTSPGRSFSGVWDADITESKAKTFVDMLTLTLEKEVGGFWRSGRDQGNWWLKGSKSNK